MFKPHGLYGHIQRNMMISRAMIASFVLATCVCWILVCIAFNMTVRCVRLNPEHLIFWRSEKPIERSTGGAPQRAACEGRGVTDVALKGAEAAIGVLHIPLFMVVGWLAYFWFAHGRIVSQLVRSVPVSRSSERRLWNTVESLAIQAGSSMPEIEVIESDSLNAFAAGLTPARSKLIVTRGLLDKLGDAELRAVVAHEYTHILNRDSRTMLVAAVFVAVFEDGFYFFKRGITGAFQSPFRGRPIQQVLRLVTALPVMLPLTAMLCLSFAVCLVPSMIARAYLSRSREFIADAGAVELTMDADSLVSALQTIEKGDHRLDVSPAMQAMMIFGTIKGMLATHPSIEERIAALRAHAGAIKPGTRIPLANAATFGMSANGQQLRTFGRRPARSSLENAQPLDP